MAVTERVRIADRLRTRLIRRRYRSKMEGLRSRYNNIAIRKLFLLLKNEKHPDQRFPTFFCFHTYPQAEKEKILVSPSELSEGFLWHIFIDNLSVILK